MKFSTSLTLALTMVFMMSPALTEARIGNSSGVVIVEDTVSVLSSQGQQPHRELSTNGWISWWDDSKYPWSKSSCLAAPFHLTPTIPNLHYCAVSDDLFQLHTLQEGSICGKCFQLNYSGGPSHFPPKKYTPKEARAGSAIIQVINSGAGDSQHFDCLTNAMRDVTGLADNGFDITYDEVACPTVPSGCANIGDDVYDPNKFSKVPASCCTGADPVLQDGKYLC